MAAANQRNKVRFGLKNTHYALITYGQDGTVTYGTPVAIPGSVSLSLDAEGEAQPFYADDTVYYTVVDNNGYTGDLEIALVPESFLTDVLKERKDANGVLVENKDSQPAHFALLFEFTGDAGRIRHVIYDCTATRPGIEGETREDKTSPKTEKISITAIPLPDGTVKAKTGETTSEETYNGWYKSVYQSTSIKEASLAKQSPQAK